MPSKQCGRCNKTVYPTEELKCLDKVWHKGCFKCQVCNMTLNMKNYKGYDKLPYCNTHYPQTKFTAVADTPENRRIQANTKIQSNIKYHEEFEKQKGKKIQIADDPEMQRVRQNMSVISNVQYHGEAERRQQMERARPAEQVEGEAQMRNRHSAHAPAPAQNLVRNIKGVSQVRANPGSISEYEPQPQQPFVDAPPPSGGGGGGTPYSNRNSAGAKQVYDSNVGREPEGSEGLSAIDARRRVSQGSVKNRVQRFSSGDGEEDQHGSSRHSGYDQRQSGGYGGMEQPPSRKVGSISDYDPMNDKYGSIIGQYGDGRGKPPQQQQQAQPTPQQAYQPPAPQPEPPRPTSKGMVVRAMYDYSAADTDEVSFVEGDVLIDCMPIDAGWMEGRVQRTGQCGMLPSNYVEQVQ